MACLHVFSHHSESTVKTFGRLEANYPPLARPPRTCPPPAAEISSRLRRPALSKGELALQTAQNGQISELALLPCTPGLYHAGAGAARGTCWTLALVASLWRWMMQVYCGGGVGGWGAGRGCRGLEGTLRRGGVSVHGLLYFTSRIRVASIRTLRCPRSDIMMCNVQYIK